MTPHSNPVFNDLAAELALFSSAQECAQYLLENFALDAAQHKALSRIAKERTATEPHELVALERLLRICSGLDCLAEGSIDLACLRSVQWLAEEYSMLSDAIRSGPISHLREAFYNGGNEDALTDLFDVLVDAQVAETLIRFDMLSLAFLLNSDRSAWLLEMGDRIMSGLAPQGFAVAEVLVDDRIPADAALVELDTVTHDDYSAYVVVCTEAGLDRAAQPCFDIMSERLSAQQASCGAVDDDDADADADADAFDDTLAVPEFILFNDESLDNIAFQIAEAFFNTEEGTPVIVVVREQAQVAGLVAHLQAKTILQDSPDEDASVH